MSKAYKVKKRVSVSTTVPKPKKLKAKNPGTAKINNPPTKHINSMIKKAISAMIPEIQKEMENDLGRKVNVKKVLPLVPLAIGGLGGLAAGSMMGKAKDYNKYPLHGEKLTPATSYSDDKVARELKYGPDTMPSTKTEKSLGLPPQEYNSTLNKPKNVRGVKVNPEIIKRPDRVRKAGEDTRLEETARANSPELKPRSTVQPNGAPFKYPDSHELAWKDGQQGRKIMPPKQVMQKGWKTQLAIEGAKFLAPHIGSALKTAAPKVGEALGNRLAGKISGSKLSGASVTGASGKSTGTSGNSFNFSNSKKANSFTKGKGGTIAGGAAGTIAGAAAGNALMPGVGGIAGGLAGGALGSFAGDKIQDKMSPPKPKEAPIPAVKKGAVGAGLGAGAGSLFGPLGAVAGGAMGSSIGKGKKVAKGTIGAGLGAGAGALMAGPIGAAAGGALGSSIGKKSVLKGKNFGMGVKGRQQMNRVGLPTDKQSRANFAQSHDMKLGNPQNPAFDERKFEKSYLNNSNSKLVSSTTKTVRDSDEFHEETTSNLTKNNQNMETSDLDMAKSRTQASLRVEKAIFALKGYNPMSDEDVKKSFHGQIPEIMKSTDSRPPQSWWEKAIQKSSTFAQDPVSYSIGLWYGDVNKAVAEKIDSKYSPEKRGEEEGFSDGTRLDTSDLAGGKKSEQTDTL